MQSVRARRARDRIAGAQSSPGGGWGGAFRGASHEGGAISPGTSVRADQRWREAVASPVVEAAWETLCGSMVQEACSPLMQPSLPVASAADLGAQNRRADWPPETQDV